MCTCVRTISLCASRCGWARIRVPASPIARYGHVRHGNEKVKVLIAKHDQPIRDGKNKGSNHVGTLKAGDAVFVCERWVECATTISRLRICVRDKDDGCDHRLGCLSCSQYPQFSAPSCLIRCTQLVARWASGRFHAFTKAGCGSPTVTQNDLATQRSTLLTTAAEIFST